MINTASIVNSTSSPTTASPVAAALAYLETEVFAIDLTGCFETGFQIAPRIFYLSAIDQRNFYFLGDVTYRQVTAQYIFVVTGS